MNSRKSIFRRLVALALWGLLIVTQSVNASTISINGSILTLFAENGDDAVFVAYDTTNLTLSFVAPLFSGATPGCTDVGNVIRECPILGLTIIRIDLLGGEDVLDMSTLPDIPALTFIVLGGDGADAMFGGASREFMYGGANDDILIGGPGINCLSGGTGDNVVIGSNCDAGPDPVFPPDPPAVPEPTGLLLLLVGLAALTITRRSSCS